jgi:MFS family permease
MPKFIPPLSDAQMSAAAAEPSQWRTHYSLLILTLIIMSYSIDRQIIGTLLEPIKKEFLATDTQMGLLAGLWFAFFHAAASIPIARVADKGNRRNVLAACCILWSFMTALCGIAANYWHLVLARTGVAISEAGGTPTTLSMTVDYYPKEQRSLAISVLTTGAFIAPLFAVAGGAWVAHQHGWRMAFFMAGVPGIILALLLWTTVPEPRRGTWDTPATYAQMPMLQTLRAILSSVSFRYIVLAYGFVTFWLMSMTTWNVSFLIRSHGMALKQAGLLIGTILPACMITGSLLSGWLCTRLVKRDARWQLGIPLIGGGIAIPTSLAYFLWPASVGIQFLGLEIPQAILFFILMCFFSSWMHAPSTAALNNVIPAHQRSVANALNLVFYTVLGFGLGPASVGMLSDALTQFAGKEGLRYSLALLTVALAISMLFYAKAFKPYLTANR